MQKKRPGLLGFELAGSLLGGGVRFSACWLLLHAAACEVNRGGSRGGAQGHDGHDGRGLVASLGKRVASRSGDGLLLGDGCALVGSLRGGSGGARVSLGLAGHHILGEVVGHQVEVAIFDPAGDELRARRSR